MIGHATAAATVSLLFAAAAITHDSEAKMTGAATPKNDVDGELLTVEFDTVGGVELGAGLHEREFHLRVHVDTSVIELAQHAPMSDFSIDPIGHFRAPLTPDEQASLARACGAAGFDRTPPPANGGLGTSLLTLRCRYRGKVKTASFSSRNIPAVDAMQPLLDAVNPLLGKALKSPLQALKVELSGPPASDGRFHFVIRNIGTMSLNVVIPSKTKDGASIGVQVAPFRNDDAPWPPPWEFLEVDHQHSGTLDKPRRLEPHDGLSLVTKRWEHKIPRRYIAQARFATYSGPPAVQALPVIKGSMLSETVTFVAP